MKKKSLIMLSCIFAVELFLSASCTKSIEMNPASAKGSISADHALAATAVVSTIAGKAGLRGNAEDGAGANARFWNPTKMVYDTRNSMLYIADGTTIRSMDPKGNVKTYMPLGIIGNYNEILDIDIAPGTAGSLYFTSKENDLWKIVPNGSSVTKIKIADRACGGNATGPLNTTDHFDGANGIASGKNGEIYFFNSFWNTLHRITLSGATGAVTNFAGKPLATRSGNAWPFKDGQGETATFAGTVPDISADANGNIYIADFRNDLVRKITPAGVVSSLFQYKNGLGIDQDGAVTIAQANRVTQVTALRDGSSVFFTTYGAGGNHTPALRVARPGKDVITLVATNTIYGDGSGKAAGLSTIGGIAATPDGKVIYVSEPGKKVIRKVTVQ